VTHITALLSSFARYTATALDDNPFFVVFDDVWFNFCDIFVYTNSCYIGDRTAQDIDVLAGDIYTITTPVNLKDLWFKNKTAGANTTVVVAGTPMTRKQAESVGIVLPH
jgi:hypothetical protein